MLHEVEDGDFQPMFCLIELLGETLWTMKLVGQYVTTVPRATDVSNISGWTPVYLLTV